MTDFEEPPNWRVRIEDADFQEGVRVVVMPCCGFSFDAIHADLDGETYSCPSCCSERLEAENERLLRTVAASRALVAEKDKALTKVLQELGVPGPGYPAPVSNAVDICHAALALTEEAMLRRMDVK